FHHRFIHCAFHLHQPTCTLVIRTRRDNSVMPQMCYRGNEVAIGLDTPNLHNRHKLLFKMLKFADAMNTRIFEKALVDIVESLDLASLFVILFQIFPSLKSNYRALLTEELSRKGGNEILLRTLEEERRRRMLALGKNVFKDEKMRLILGSFAFLSDSEKRQAFLDEHLGNSWIDILERILNCSETENRSVFLEASLVLKAKLGEMRAISKTFNKDYAVI
ncbi:MAG: hypothetical protein KDD35_09960, partial [Bdellovibrionales bacterium]|nr:hypothetical protein [Bdellovibrionales bacterium]